MVNIYYLLFAVTPQKIKFFIKDFFSKCERIRRKLQIGSHLVRKFSWKTSFCMQDHK